MEGICVRTMVTLAKILKKNHDWAIDQIHHHCDSGDIESAYSIQCEFDEWLDPNTDEHDILSLEYFGEESQFDI